MNQSKKIQNVKIQMMHLKDTHKSHINNLQQQQKQRIHNIQLKWKNKVKSQIQQIKSHLQAIHHRKETKLKKTIIYLKEERKSKQQRQRNLLKRFQSLEVKFKNMRYQYLSQIKKTHHTITHQKTKSGKRYLLIKSISIYY